MTGPTYDRGWLDELPSPDDLGAPEYGTSMHYPACIDRSCTGCLPPLPDWIGQPAPVTPALGIDPARQERVDDLAALASEMRTILAGRWRQP